VKILDDLDPLTFSLMAAASVTYVFRVVLNYYTKYLPSPSKTKRLSRLEERLEAEITRTAPFDALEKKTKRLTEALEELRSLDYRRKEYDIYTIEKIFETCKNYGINPPRRFF